MYWVTMTDNVDIPGLLNLIYGNSFNMPNKSLDIDPALIRRALNSSLPNQEEDIYPNDKGINFGIYGEDLGKNDEGKSEYDLGALFEAYMKFGKSSASNNSNDDD